MYIQTQTGQWTMTRAVQHIEILRLLIENGADVNRWDGNGNTPLHNALRYIESTRLLLGSGADVNANNDPDCKINLRWGPLHHAANGVNPEFVKLLLAYGADSNIRKKDGQTPLFLAAGRRYTPTDWDIRQAGGKDGNIEIIEMLIAHGADVNASTDMGWTPLLSAIEVGAAEAVRVLIKRGARVKNLPRCPSQFAKQCGHKSIAEYLVIREAI